jgi:ADP-ribose pyrophosphatase YjhB (NUDIX family)
MKFCSACGHPVSLSIPEGDNRPRFVCQQCDTIHYQNPNIVAGVIARHEDKILLCKRAIDPRIGKWTLPAGFLENSETVMQGAAREAMEEANAVLADMQLFNVISIPHISQVYMMYRAELVDGAASAGPESEAVALYAEHEIPWQEMAFPVVIESMQLYFEDLARGDFRTHYGDIVKQADMSLQITRY